MSTPPLSDAGRSDHPRVRPGRSDRLCRRGRDPGDRRDPAGSRADAGDQASRGYRPHPGALPNHRLREHRHPPARRRCPAGTCRLSHSVAFLTGRVGWSAIGLPGKRVLRDGACREPATGWKVRLRRAGNPRRVPRGGRGHHVPAAALLRRLCRLDSRSRDKELATVRDSEQATRILRLAAARSASLTNLSSIGRELGIDHKTVGNHLRSLEQLFMVIRLPAWHANLGPPGDPQP